MSKPTVSAAGGAMPAEGRETHTQSFARLRVLRLSLERSLDEMGAVLDAVDDPPAARREPNPSKMGDQIDIIKGMVDAAYMAAGDLHDFQRAAMRSLLDETSTKIGAVQKEFTEVYCGGYVDV